MDASIELALTLAAMCSGLIAAMVIFQQPEPQTPPPSRYVSLDVPAEDIVPVSADDYSDKVITLKRRLHADLLSIPPEVATGYALSRPPHACTPTLLYSAAALRATSVIYPAD